MRTKGPWRRDKRHDTSNEFYVYGRPHPEDGGNYAPICTVSNPSDADLIAMAPELFSACDFALRHIEMYGDPEADEEHANMLRHVIAKAMGGGQ